MNEKFVSAALDSECNDLAGTAKGSRNNALFVSAAKMGQLVSAGLSESQITRRLLSVAEEIGLVKDDGRDAVLATIRGGIERGKQTPRQITSQGSASNVSILNMQRRVTKPTINPQDEPRSMIAATPADARITPTTLPTFTPPNEAGRPKFGEWPEPYRGPGEIRRHVYRRGDAVVMVNVKWRERQDAPTRWTPWFRVMKGDRLGWQAKRPAGFEYVPYIPAGTDPFAPGDVRALAWCEARRTPTRWRPSATRRSRSAHPRTCRTASVRI
jgi:hypothetical protein